MKALISAVAAGVIALAGVTHAFAGEAKPPPTETVADQQQTLDIVDTAVAAGSFTTLAAALEAADLVETLKGEGPFTVFAPTDDAFAALPAGTVEGLLADIPALTDVLLYHVVSGDVRAADVVALSSATTVGGKDISIEVVGGEVILNGSIKVVTTDIVASNGVIHVIDGVLIPQVDDAAGAPPAAQTADIVDTAVAAGSFTTLAAALDAADLVGTLKGEGPFTVFAPTDDAFAALPAGTVEGLLNDIPALTDILLYHVVSGDVRAADVVNLSSATTVGGQDISIAVVGGEVILNGSIKVVTTDIVASNGVIHVIDGVLIPQAATAAPAPPDAGSGNLAEDLTSGGSALWLALGVAAAGIGLLGAARFATRRARS